ncbi:PAS domain S-box-containing protein/diguanylate cyclase (GGDEF) domain-containing protein [Alteromonadaceae bacterium Bs31]|nr:PAS domain S-box-containing protein/diguanylate cyclase (GGDEF) domain-containing protein [Alteromonadaceae bacterium Bs31]
MVMLNNAQILVVSRNGNLLGEVQKYLGDGGFHSVITARSSQAALGILRNNRVDMLISSLDLEDMDGWRLARLVRCGALHCSANLPILMLTEVWCQRVAEVTAREYGVNRLLPISALHELVSTVSRCLKGEFVPHKKPRLLVIEDAKDTADLVKRVLDRLYQVDLVDNGEDGLRLWRRYQHSLVLLDYMLPNISGKEILKKIIAEKPDQAVVMMTAHSSGELAEEVMLLGATDFLSKPFRTEQLRKVCELAVRREDFLQSNQQFAEKVCSLEESEQAYRKMYETHQQLLHNLQTVVMELDGENRLTFLNYPWKVLMGYEVEECIGKQLKDYLPPDDGAASANLESSLNDVWSELVPHHELELCLLDKEGQKLWAQMKVRRSSHNEQASLTICLDNITKRKEAQEQLEYLAMHDSLTGLFNRRYFEESLRHIYADAIRNKRKHGLIYIDLDFFKIINDTFGHQEGDEVLRQISNLMSRRVRASDLLCRLGGDEYALLVHDVNEKVLYEIAQELQIIINDFTYQAKGHRVNLGCSAGLAVIDGAASCAEEYLMQADIALYVAKGRGRNIIHQYDEEDNESEELRSRINWTQQVRSAIIDNRVILHYQPVIDCSVNDVAYYEALVRMVDESGKIIFPNSFIPALENTGEMHLLDRWIVKLAVANLAENPNLKRIAINLSAQAFKDENLVPVIKEALSAHLVDPAAITFELTESASLFNLNVTKRVIAELHAIGCTFAIDDFGSGFSSFSYLKELPADYIKLDGSFIRQLHKDDVDKALVRSLIQVVQALGKKAVAEFVENEEILQILNDFGVDMVQGYHIGRPMPLEDIYQREKTFREYI